MTYTAGCWQTTVSRVTYCLLQAVPILEPQGAYGDAEKVSDSDRGQNF